MLRPALQSAVIFASNPMLPAHRSPPTAARCSRSLDREPALTAVTSPRRKLLADLCWPTPRKYFAARGFALDRSANRSPRRAQLRDLVCPRPIQSPATKFRGWNDLSVERRTRRREADRSPPNG